MDLYKILIVQIAIIVLLLSCYDTVFESKNKLTLERFTCAKPPPESKVQHLHCLFKYISRDNLKIHLHWNLTGRVEEAWMHGVFYYKFNGLVYSKFPIDVWENICEFLDGKTEKTWGLNWIVAKLIKYSNFNHSCPYDGYMFAKVDNISMNTFAFRALIPSGRYRVDVAFTEADRVPMVELQIFFSVSDHRIEIV